MVEFGVVCFLDHLRLVLEGGLLGVGELQEAVGGRILGAEADTTDHRYLQVVVRQVRIANDLDNGPKL